MEISTLRDQLTDQLVAFAWNEWAQMGLSATAQGRSRWAQDPEALIVFSLDVARTEPRLFDELMDWILINESLLSVRRLRVMCIDEIDSSLIQAALAWLAKQRPRARRSGRVGSTVPLALKPLFGSEIHIEQPDEAFASAGWLRSVLRPSHKSKSPDFGEPINLAFQLRQILGVGIRAEVIRVLLSTGAPWMNAQTLAMSTGYAKRNVHEALTGLSASQVISSFTINGEQRYALPDPSVWASLLSRDDLPFHRDWQQLLTVLRHILRWSCQPELEALSDYLKASSARDLLESLRNELAFVGIPLSLGSSPQDTWRELEDVIGRALNTIGVSIDAIRSV
jgi:hypothetical protein